MDTVYADCKIIPIGFDIGLSLTGRRDITLTLICIEANCELLQSNKSLLCNLVINAESNDTNILVFGFA